MGYETNPNPNLDLQLSKFEVRIRDIYLDDVQGTKPRLDKRFCPIRNKPIWSLEELPQSCKSNTHIRFG